MSVTVTGIHEKINPEPNLLEIPTPAEALLSIIAKGNPMAIEASKLLVSSDFTNRKDQLIFDGFLSLQERGIEIDMVSMKTALPPGTEAGAYFLRLLRIEERYVVDPSKSDSFVALIREAGQKRRQLDSVAGLGKAIKAGEGQAAALELLHDSMSSTTTAGGPVGDYLKDYMRYIEARQKGEGPAGVMSGITDLDEITNGFHPGNFIIIAARPAMGKTALALNIAHFNTVRSENRNKAMVPTLFLSLEMTKEELTGRILSAESGVNSSRFGRIKGLDDGDWPRLTSASGRIYGAPLYIDDTGGLGIDELCARSRRWKQEKNIGLIIVDYLQLVKSPKGNNRQEEVAEISRALKELAKSLQVPVIALSQLNRDLEKRADKRPIMSDLRESGGLEQDADLILFVFREAVYCDDCKDPRVKCIKGHDRDAEIIIGKMRNGTLGNVPVYFWGETQQFRNREWRHDDRENILREEDQGQKQDNNSMPKDSQAQAEKMRQMAEDLGVEVSSEDFDEL